mgnify:CR=1 FL=1
MIDIEIQNETHQTHERVKFAVVPRIGEGVRLQDPKGFWASYDILDLWYQKAEYGDVWVPFLHVRQTQGEVDSGLTADNANSREMAKQGQSGEVLPFVT